MSLSGVGNEHLQKKGRFGFLSEMSDASAGDELVFLIIQYRDFKNYMEQDNRKKLITEKITGRKLTPERLIRFAIIAALCGVVFGMTAAAAFGYVESGRKKQHAQAQTDAAVKNDEQIMQESDIVSAENAFQDGAQSIAPDTEGDTLPAEGGAGTEAADSDHSGASVTDQTGASGTDHSEVSDIDQTETSAADHSEASVTDQTRASGDEEKDGTPFPDKDEEEYQRQLDMYLNRAASVIDSSLVSIAAAEQTETWFESAAEEIRYYSGVVLKIDEREILILTTGEKLDKKKLRVTFCNGSTLDGYFKQYSQTDGLTVIAVSATEGISEETLSAIKSVEYANTEELTCGDMIIATGSPIGVMGSIDFGTVAYISESEMHVDGEQYIFYSDISSDSEKGTFIVDFEGRLVGISTSEASCIGVASDITRIVGINSLRRVISSMLSGEKRTYLGINGTEVGFGMKYNSSIPEGVYLNDVIEDSPAYNVGIRRGDIIVSLAGRDIVDMDSFTRALNSCRPGQSVSLRVMRGSVNSEYHEMEYSVILGER